MKGEFILYQLRTLEKDLKDKGTGTTFKSISKSILENLPLKIPPLNEQNRIVSKIEELFSELDHAEKGLKKAKHQLEIYMQALLKSAFEGKLTEKWRIENSFEKLKSHHSKDNVLPLGWSYSKIGKIAGFIGSGSTPRGGKNVYQENGIPFIRSQNIQVNCLIQDDLVYISDRVHEKMQRTHTQPKDILLNITGASIGRCAFVPENFEKGNVNQHVCIIRVLPEYVNFNYLTYYLNSPINQLLIKRINSGATREALNLTQIKNITLPMCSIKEQEQIVCELDSKLTLIGNMQESIKIELLNIEKVKHSILNKAFCGKLVHQDSNEETAMALLNRIRIEKNSYLKIVKTNKMNTSANNKNSIKRKDLLEIIKEKFAGTEFSFEQIRKLSDKSYDDLKAELYLLLDKNKELEIIFNKNLKKILFKVKS
jgi:type I restriction enzyme S subunit